MLSCTETFRTRTCVVRSNYVHLSISNIIINRIIMKTITRNTEDERIEFRVSKAEKKLYDYASSIKGFKRSEFIRLILRTASEKIIEEDKQILASEQDKEIFFNALMGNESKPNDALISAIQFHNEMLAK